MTPPSASIPAPEIPLEATEDAFWSVVQEVAGGIEIHEGSEQMLREMIKAGLDTMHRENRLSAADLFSARGSLATFVLEMKSESRTRGHPEWLGEDTTAGAAKRFQVMGIRLWPFIPPPWQVW
jgi:cytosine/adenosine deaminase-related metal-dependent hydrolase